MTRRLEYTPEASVDIEDAASWLLSRAPSLVACFVDALEEALEGIRLHPETWARLDDELRRALVRRFPYAVYYRVEAERVLIVAVLHQRRAPRTWQARERRVA